MANILLLWAGFISFVGFACATFDELYGIAAFLFILSCVLILASSFL